MHMQKQQKSNTTKDASKLTITL